MARWEPDGRQRLYDAAMTLFAERGFAGTTAAAIAEQAGLTERTFFRHFPDKRDVLFANEAAMTDRLVAAVAAVPAGADVREAVDAALAALVADLQPRRAALVEREAIVDGVPELQERELIKLASWTAALAGALRARGVAAPTAALAAEVAIAVLRAAAFRWLEGADGTDLAALLAASFDELGAVVLA